ncbi:nucleotide pyrophosphatase/phosphodiesterase family protein [Aureliella helgolandensis]|uniref:Type I phosphodiesterase / nucleotide pyrophosphatase n=1 Tax=Aureliella helgolandensis TaxID=2527968 RepID=A0A518G094_9BACT|nr:nucleotide pyrophosphatase/phosphodiesterase family protein [Aureliella helgolandensis]QDV22019.1 Type I phosphodiesterase / nucleotide pyrophosphatase [Aureliella helgolandensis]
MSKVCVINVVGLTQKLVEHAPRIASVGKAHGWQSPYPAVTCTSQATMLTGLSPREHGIVGNGWYFRDTGEIRFWQQSNRLMAGEKLYEGVPTAKMFWWFNQGAPVTWFATPKPYYGSDGSKAFGILDKTECDLTTELGEFPFFSFWGPKAGLPSSDWIARASALVMRRKRPELTMVYLPHLDYDFQRLPIHDPERVREVDRCAGMVIDAAEDIGATPIVVSEYGLVPVSRPVEINRALRRAGLLEVRDGPFGETLMTMDSKAFAVVDHQLAHIYINDVRCTAEVRRIVEDLPGVASVVEPGELQLDHARSGELIALANDDAWFVYYYWLDDRRAPDFATSVDIHRKPGYDPCELFMTSPLRAAARLLQKKLGMRYRMDVIPLDPSLVKGSHGLRPSDSEGAVIVGPDAPTDMRDFKAYVRRLLASSKVGPTGRQP